MQEPTGPQGRATPAQQDGTSDPGISEPPAVGTEAQASPRHREGNDLPQPGGSRTFTRNEPTVGSHPYRVGPDVFETMGMAITSAARTSVRNPGAFIVVEERLTGAVVWIVSDDGTADRLPR